MIRNILVDNEVYTEQECSKFFFIGEQDCDKIAMLTNKGKEVILLEGNERGKFLEITSMLNEALKNKLVTIDVICSGKNHLATEIVPRTDIF